MNSNEELQEQITQLNRTIFDLTVKLGIQELHINGLINVAVNLMAKVNNLNSSDARSAVLDVLRLSADVKRGQ